MRKLIKTGLTGVSRDDAEQLENYLLRYGVRGRALEKPFTRGEVSPMAERAREVLMAPLMQLRNELAVAETAANKTEAVKAYLEAIGLREQLISLTQNLKEKNQLKLMDENAQVYNMLMEMLVQLHAIMGDVKMPTSRYVAIVEEAIAAYDVSAIPTMADQVLFGSAGRTRARDVRMLLALGANEGMFPASVSDDALIDDHELKLLGETGITPWTSSAELNAKELSDVYGVITKPSERLCISYQVGSGGEGAVACSLIDRMKNMFPLLKEQTSLDEREPVSPEDGFLTLTRRLRSNVDAGNIDGFTSNLYSSFTARSEYAHRIALCEDALYHHVSPEPFGKELATMLYANVDRKNIIPNSYGVTRLETFNSCPFKHYARYGLRVEERKEYSERHADEGAFCHAALERFTQAIMDENVDIKSLTEADIDCMFNTIFPELIATHNHGILMETARNRAQCARLVRRVKATAKAMVKQLASGGFKALGSEVSFGNNAQGDLKNPLPALEIELRDGTLYRISGKIDRVDGFTSETGTKYIRVIDYKTGNTDFKYEDVYHGLKLQLPLYLSAMLAADRVAKELPAAKAAGMYYLPVKDPAVKEGLSPEVIEMELHKQFKLNGITLNEIEIVEASADTMRIKQDKSNITNREVFDDILSFALEKSKETAEGILGGRAETTPYWRGKTDEACSQCDYGALCRFDTTLDGCAYRKVSSMKGKDFFGAMRNGE